MHYVERESFKSVLKDNYIYSSPFDPKTTTENLTPVDESLTTLQNPFTGDMFTYEVYNLQNLFCQYLHMTGDVIVFH